MNIIELLTRTLKTDIEYICLNITTITDIYPLCFIDYEDHEKLGVYVTHDDGRERFAIIYIAQIVALEVVYQNDIKITDKDDNDIMVV